jgi:putative tryptophan/tyrosine transport system substrate-binding protein
VAAGRLTGALGAKQSATRRVSIHVSRAYFVQGPLMKRRQATVALAVLGVVPFAGEGQPTARSHRVGFLGLSSPSDYAPYLNAFLQGLRELGYVEGTNIVIDYRWADGREERLPELATELVALKPDVLVAHAVGVGAAQRATSSIPIVMGVSGDPVALGLIKSLARPGGNTTGIASQMTNFASKYLELLKELVPKLKAVAILSNLSLPTVRKGLEEIEIAARKLGVRVQSFRVTADASPLESAFAAILRDRPDGLVVQPDPITGRHGARIAAFAASNQLPSIAGGRQFVIDGGLASYGSSFVEGWRTAARYVDKILRGARPADLPVEQTAAFELVINLRTAKTLGLTVPPSLLLRANEVIQ